MNQNNQCVGLFGKIFGHSFLKYLVKEKVCHPLDVYTSLNLEGEEGVLAYIESQRNTYTVRCKRCGLEKK